MASRSAPTRHRPFVLSTAGAAVGALLLPALSTGEPPSLPAAGPATGAAAQTSTQPSTQPTTQAATSPATNPSPPAASRPAEPALPEVEEWVAQLQSENWKQRQAAQGKLVAFGEQAVPRLQRLVKETGDEEARTRARAALGQIAENAVSGASMVTLHLQNVTPQEAFAQLARQAHCEFPAYPAGLWEQPRALVSLDVDRQPFWAAMVELCNKTGLQLQQVGNDRRLYLMANGSNWFAGPPEGRRISGAFLVVQQSINHSVSIDFQGARQENSAISFCVFPEPKLRVIQASYIVKLEEAIDENGNSYLPSGNWNDGMTTGGGYPWNLTGRLQYPPKNRGEKFVSLKGSGRFLIQTKGDVLEVPDVIGMKNVERSVSGRRVRIKDARKNGEQYEINLALLRDGMGNAEWQQMRTYSARVQLLDAQNRPLSLRGSGWGGGGANEMDFSFQFGREDWGVDNANKPGEPAKLVWEVPVETKDLAVPFEFKDVKLP